MCIRDSTTTNFFEEIVRVYRSHHWAGDATQDNFVDFRLKVKYETDPPVCTPLQCDDDHHWD